MKTLLSSNKLLFVFLVGLFFFNLLQGYTTELLADEAYYWVYSNFLDWGYFDHPPMVAVWISISKLFFATGELSVRFFSAITLSITFYFLWLLIEHPKKKENTGLFILLISSTALFNVYGFITVPDTPLLFFMAIFLLGYKKYIHNQLFFSYLMMTIGISGMMYSKYQAILIVFFVLLSNLKALKDYKIWGMTFVIIIFYLPHLYWQYNNGYPSFKYHLVERTANKTYKLEYSLMLFVNMLAIVGLTFPVLYYAFYKNLKNKQLFQRALNFIVIGFIAFFFISTFKGPTQAQWIVPISFSLIIISFNFIVERPQIKKTFIKLAAVSIVLILSLRFLMANDVLPKQMEMHGNKAWVNRLDEKVNGKEIMFSNSYQKPSLFWFYSGKRPFQYNSWYKRKNHYDLLAYNQKINQKEIIHTGSKYYSNDSVLGKNGKYVYLKTITNYIKEGVVITSINPIIKNNSINTIQVSIENPNNIDLKSLNLEVIYADKKRKTLKTVTKKDRKNTPQIFKANLIDINTLQFTSPDFGNNFTPAFVQIIGRNNTQTKPIRIGFIACEYKKK